MIEGMFHGATAVPYGTTHRGKSAHECIRYAHAFGVHLLGRYSRVVVRLPRGKHTTLTAHSLRGSTVVVHLSSWRNGHNLLCATETHARRSHRKTPYQPSGRAHYRAYRHGRGAVAVPLGPPCSRSALYLIL